jgi:hypothetical protein
MYGSIIHHRFREVPPKRGRLQIQKPRLKREGDRHDAAARYPRTAAVFSARPASNKFGWGTSHRLFQAWSGHRLTVGKCSSRPRRTSTGQPYRDVFHRLLQAVVAKPIAHSSQDGSQVSAEIFLWKQLEPFRWEFQWQEQTRGIRE